MVSIKEWDTLLTWRSVKRMPGDLDSRLSIDRVEVTLLEWLRGRDIQL